MPAARRFAIVSPNLYPRVCGVGDHSFRVGQELIRRGYDVELFSRAPAESHPEAPDLRVHGAIGRTPLAVMSNLDRALANFGPSVVILQYTSQMWEAWRFGSPAVPWLIRRLSRRGVGVILLAHELFVPFLRRPDLALAAVLQRAQMLAVLRGVDDVFVSTGTRAKIMAPLCRVAGAPAPRVVRIGPNANPIPRRADAHPRTFRIGFFSTAGVGKRFDVALEAFRVVAARHPETELVLIGDLGAVDNPRVRQIQEWIGRHPARDRIRVTGKLSLEQIAGEMSQLDLYVSPMDTGANSRSGTLPLALGTGLAVVATRGIDTDVDLFRDGENIAFATEMSGSAFGEMALRLIDAPETRARIGAAARRVYEEEMSWPRITDALLASSAASRHLLAEDEWPGRARTGPPPLH